ncbi:MAG TPA: type II secretion system F family protein [Pirellulales bacterium]|nr:type II secretion system F family protein [Pirellulales bacterium]
MSSTLVTAQSFPGLVLLGIAVLASLHLFYRDRAEGEDPLHLIMSVIGRVMIVTGFVEGCLVFLNFMAIPFFFFAGFVLLYTIFRYLLRRRMALLAVMAAAARRWMPLAPAVEAFSHECRGPLGRRCRRLTALLNAGVPLGEAIREAGRQGAVEVWSEWLFFPRLMMRVAGPLVPRRAAALVEVGVRTGNISGALVEAVRQPISQSTMTRVGGAIWYIGTIVVFGTMVLTFMAVKIVPAFIKIFDDFDAELPPLTVALIQSCDWFADYGWPLVLVGFAGLACFLLLWSVDLISWLPPPLNMLSRRRESIFVLRSLAVAAQADRPLLPALAALAEHGPSLAMRQHSRRAMERMEQGMPWQECLAEQGLLRRGELALLNSAERVGNLSWALGEVAEGIERRFALRMHRWLEVLVPLCVLAAGAMVLFIVVGLFVPLISLIEKLT